VDGCCSSGQWTEVVRVLKEIPGDGFGPDVVTCNLLMDYLCKEGLCADTRKIFASMDKKGLKPNVVTYSILLHGYATVATKGAFDVINNLFTSMMANGIAQTRAYGLVAAAGESHAAGRGSAPASTPSPFKMEAATVGSINKKNGIARDHHVFSILICASGKYEIVNEAMLLFTKMRKQGLSP
jgi:pentatricopeptide repeat protein